ncbi:hypothetical protein SAMD00019534_097080 [Acytostelium subglobosum LB1]|uniref:hypothetical protein n=1 Tax=Acytostelium subglobosum LB1 TaxID=1410327 RepID=UPI000644922D|nr:hypothetical protein SAMD00019534_097080 [Acytostelium subglobosum LB1]GAM26533.1 hypothetical protein SAMD00019534_097080 [Acytostelium subglobosum LB1]|eukprot:XP_012750629.1 hypothetical protein SAMD00019534_097080 [Acytostelium subglobosum LB1]
MSDNDFPVLGSKESRRRPDKNAKPFQYQPQVNVHRPVQGVAPVPAPVHVPAPVPVHVPAVGAPPLAVVAKPAPAPGAPMARYPSIIDIGANLADKSFERDLQSILQRSTDKGVNHIIITGTSIRSSQRALELIANIAKNNVVGAPKLYCTAGVHPHEAERAPRTTISDIRSMVTNNPGVVVSLGECGLDFNRNFSSHESQCNMFRSQIELAIELKMPLFIHERDAHQKFMEIVSKYTSTGTMPKSVIHCFTGTEQEAAVYLAAGFYFGFTGVITQGSRGDTLRKILRSKTIPLSRVMIETDCPYMTPHNIDPKDKPKPQAGSKHLRNEPAFLTCVLSTLAECYGITVQEAALQTTNTTREFFGLP